MKKCHVQYENEEAIALQVRTHKIEIVYFQLGEENRWKYL